MKTGDTVAWLAPIMYEAMLRTRVDMTEFRRGETITTLPWDQTSEEERTIFREALRAALTALDDPALLKLHEHEPIFVLRSQDQVAPMAVDYWRHVAFEAGMARPSDKGTRSGKRVQEMFEWQAAHSDLVKIPD